MKKYTSISEENELKRAASGCLMELEAAQKPAPKVETSKRGHLMLSYNHGSAEIVRKVRDLLKEAGYKTWFDEDDIRGSIIDAMASAVEGAAAILVFYSEEYYKSPNCRQEAQYSFKLKKPIIPIRVQEKYQPEGWLGFILASELYFDLSTSAKFSINYQKLLREVEKLISSTTTKESNETRAYTQTFQGKTKEDSRKPDAHEGHSQRMNERSTRVAQHEVTFICQNWTIDQVQNWLAEKNLTYLQDMYGKTFYLSIFDIIL